jgi:hypothetical protein
MEGQGGGTRGHYPPPHTQKGEKFDQLGFVLKFRSKRFHKNQLQEKVKKRVDAAGQSSALKKVTSSGFRKKSIKWFTSLRHTMYTHIFHCLSLSTALLWRWIKYVMNYWARSFTTMYIQLRCCSKKAWVFTRQPKKMYFLKSRNYLCRIIVVLWVFTALVLYLWSYDWHLAQGRHLLGSWCILVHKYHQGVARWYLCIPKIPIWVYFGELWIGKLNIGIYYAHLE